MNKSTLPALLTLISSLVLFVLGLWVPLMATKQKLFGFTIDYQEVRLLDSVRIFFEDGDWLLASVILIFTFLFPILKYADLSIRLLKPGLFPASVSKVLKLLDRWSMLDVFIVAVLLLNAKLDSSLIVMTVKQGTTFIALSVILRMVASELIFRQENKKRAIA